MQNVVTVWAPKAKNVQLIIRDRTANQNFLSEKILDEQPLSEQKLFMDQGENGWWKINTPLAQHGVDYAFIIDGSKPLPDPRSPWQPEGVHGFSRFYSQDLFHWNDNQWQPRPLSSAICYELHVGTFSTEGTFKGVIQQLDHLLALGITHLELMPVNTFLGDRGWGYDGVDIYAPFEPYGGPDGLKQLVDICHQKGLTILLDVVYNHLGAEGNYLDFFAPYLSLYHETVWGKAINMDGAESDEVRRFFIDNALMWLRDYHIDGLRLDAVHALVDTSAIHFLEQLAKEVGQLSAYLGKHLTLIAESNLNDPKIIRPPELGGYGIDAQWNDDFHHALHTVLTGEQTGYYIDYGKLYDLAKAFKQAFVYDNRYSRFRKKSHGRPIHELSGQHFMVFTQNHDQVGNRAKGERLSQLVSTGKQKIAAAFLLTSPFIPLIFQGEEWGAVSPFLYFTGHTDPVIGEAVRKGRQQEFAAFGWKPEEIPDPLSPKTFLQSKLRWKELTYKPHNKLFYWYQTLTKIRHTFPELTDGRLDRVEVRFDEQAKWFILRRGRILLVCNLAPSAQSVLLPVVIQPLPATATEEPFPRVLLYSEETVLPEFIPGEGLAGSFLPLPPESVILLQLRDS
jgi:maltooligosyltrehalose trehalohydrolase